MQGRGSSVSSCSSFAKGDTYELVVLGAGPVGVKAAIEAASLGVRSTIIDPNASISSLPTGAHSKCLREAAMEGIKTWDGIGQMMSAANKTAVGMTTRELKTFHIEVMQGTAVVTGPDTLLFTPTAQREEEGEGEEAKLVEKEVCTQTLSFHVLVIATGSISQRLPEVKVDYSAPGVYDSSTVKAIRRIPKRLVVQGAGIIAVQYAQIFKRLGCESVVVACRNKNFVSRLDIALSEACRASLLSAGVEILPETPIDRVIAMEGSTLENPLVRVVLQGGKTLECDCFLSATGCRGNTEALGLESLGPELKLSSKGFVEVDNNGWTGLKGVYAVGDVAGSVLVTAGQAQAQRAIWHRYASGFDSEEETVHPKVVWSIPEFAWAGMSEEEARATGKKCGTVTIQFQQTMRGCMSSGEAGQGFLKLVYLEEEGNVVGVHIFGEASSEHISFGADLVQDETSVYDLQQFVFPSCTYHELYHRAAAEATLKMRHAGATDNIGTSAAWNRVIAAVRQNASTQGVSEHEVLREAFKKFDSDLCGFISKDDMKKALESLGLEVDDETVGNMVWEATGGQQNLVDYQFFLGILKLRQQDHQRVCHPSHTR